jgi:hypothetical protein
LPLIVDKIYVLQIRHGTPALGRRFGCLPALPQFLNPGSRQPALQAEPEFLRTIVNRNLEHFLKQMKARAMPSAESPAFSGKSARLDRRLPK